MKFNKLLSPAIVISEYSQKIQKIDQFTNITDNNIEIIQCVFSQIDSKNFSTNGGALLCENNETNAVIIRSGFIYCKSIQKGGCIYMNCKSVNISMTCFEDSRAMGGCQAFYLSASLIDLDDSIISECGMKKNDLVSTTTQFYKSPIRIQNSNVSCNRRVLFDCGLTFIECLHAELGFTSIANNLGNGLFNFEFINPSKLNACNVINNSGSDASPMINLNIQNFVFQKVTFAKNSIPQFLEIINAKSILFSNCRFDLSLLEIGSYEEIQITLCKFEQTNPNLNRLRDPLQFRCYALSATDPPELILEYNPHLVQKKETFFAEPTKIDIDMNKEPEVNWMPPKMLAKQYGLILFTSIITPIFIVIHCITSKGSREIRALN
ncbi:hypothetical protein TVAG_436400 [Trichomonas vaginalis G3]|uniref:Uncharacterized protein n=1 Tax=Trichomonas vaginalis (strain ATCC PRA-98 / G3) TaxID=412133 RepID=A2DF88_TRIV3|nr:hypothetical protein TVAGG3_0565890 [Trichomonas vaginalis G3]EAY20816.1 hypothetical protein TVAG_436400 [Trichomonas vaginalis G3]KAI5521576.1 hypothetical protein TVAGG3_0565890 [Trichomonas vaginalis G3]|eukprot:XP_001581802.1 hypothetical protein [Trichomonas vaginalis G3]